MKRADVSILKTMISNAAISWWQDSNMLTSYNNNNNKKLEEFLKQPSEQNNINVIIDNGNVLSFLFFYFIYTIHNYLYS